MASMSGTAALPGVGNASEALLRESVADSEAAFATLQAELEALQSKFEGEVQVGRLRVVFSEDLHSPLRLKRQMS
jgi:uncharacterized protein YpuA (DUF1002 family)